MPQPFEVDEEDLLQDLDTFVNEVFSELESQFVVLPRGEGFLTASDFEIGYNELRKVTQDFQDFTPPAIVEAVYRVPVSFIVLRTILGFTPPEWAYVASANLGIEIPQGAVRSIDRNIRIAPLAPITTPSAQFESRVRALIEAACRLVERGAPPSQDGMIHRLDKMDTRHGLSSVRKAVRDGVPYSTLLYERFLGRPFAGHRDSVSEKIGDVLEDAVEGILNDHGVPFHRTGRAERIRGFDQAPDFLIPNADHPKLVIEAKLTEDDGTARDKVTRIQHLGTLSRKGLGRNDEPHFEVAACIAGRGFRVRREDMRKLLVATRGKVFTMSQIPRIVYHTVASEFVRHRET